jgi:hypothetical protein
MSNIHENISTHSEGGKAVDYLGPNQIIILRELSKGPVKNVPRGLHGDDMEILVKAGCVVATPENDGTVSHEITEAGRAAYERSQGPSMGF